MEETTWCFTDGSKGIIDKRRKSERELFIMIYELLQFGQTTESDL